MQQVLAGVGGNVGDGDGDGAATGGAGGGAGCGGGAAGAPGGKGLGGPFPSGAPAKLALDPAPSGHGRVTYGPPCPQLLGPSFLEERRAAAWTFIYRTYFDDVGRLSRAGASP